MSQTDFRDAAEIIQQLREPLAAILSNAQAGQRMGEPDGMGEESREILSDIVDDGKRAGELLRRLEALLLDGGE